MSRGSVTLTVKEAGGHTCFCNEYQVLLRPFCSIEGDCEGLSSPHNQFFARKFTCVVFSCIFFQMPVGTWLRCSYEKMRRAKKLEGTSKEEEAQTQNCLFLSTGNWYPCEASTKIRNNLYVSIFLRDSILHRLLEVICIIKYKSSISCSKEKSERHLRGEKPEIIEYF